MAASNLRIMISLNVLVFFLLITSCVKAEKEMVFEMEIDWFDLNEYDVTFHEKRSNSSALLCYLKCKSNTKEFLPNGSIVLDMVNIFFDEKLFILDGTIRNIILECMGSNLSIETCGENYSRCKPLLSKRPNISKANTTCCLQESTLNMTKLDWTNFLGFPKETDCLMKCIEARKGIFDKKGEAAPLNLFFNTEHVEIIPAKKQTFRRCVLNGTGVHTCKEIIHLYICFFRNLSKASERMA